MITRRGEVRARRFQWGTVLVLLLGGAAGGRADDLISVPGADRGDPGSLSLSAEYDGARGVRAPTALGILSTGYDISTRLTLGADLLLSRGARRTTVLSPNGSLLLFRTGGGLRARAGFQNVGVRSFGEQPYASVVQSVSRLDLVAGWTRDSGRNRLMLGLDGKLAPRWALLADWVTGGGNFAAVGMRYSFSEQRALTLGFLRANAREDGDGIYVLYGVSWKVSGRGAANPPGQPPQPSGERSPPTPSRSP
jgi:hypothetical protein